MMNKLLDDVGIVNTEGLLGEILMEIEE